MKKIIATVLAVGILATTLCLVANASTQQPVKAASGFMPDPNYMQ